MVRPLRSTPITGASSLLRTGPPARPASVLNTSQFLLLSALPLTTPNPAGGGIGTCLPTFHAAAADQDRVAFMPDSRVAGGISAPGSHGTVRDGLPSHGSSPVSYTHLRAHETVLDLVCRLLLEKKKKTNTVLE